MRINTEMLELSLGISPSCILQTPTVACFTYSVYYTLFMLRFLCFHSIMGAVSLVLLVLVLFLHVVFSGILCLFNFFFFLY